MRTIAARFDGKCSACGKAIQKGKAAEYDEFTRKIFCSFECVPKPDSIPLNKEYDMADELGYVPFNWDTPVSGLLDKMQPRRKEEQKDLF